ncbi:hypothetical protein Bca52824_041121 [Brassica carinata]|uniref:Uncharacterized protein n=1 Tax=Brassica carinata TaxID=52824 RepID=A0A8X7UXG5_BRACI|nr:hypothetical protein Bca52824_041121 [Brassica carinata]
MAQMQREPVESVTKETTEKKMLDGGGGGGSSASKASSFKFNAQAPEFVPRSHATALTPQQRMVQSQQGLGLQVCDQQGCMPLRFGQQTPMQQKNHDADADANATPTATKITTNATRDRPTRLQCKKDLGNKD